MASILQAYPGGLRLPGRKPVNRARIDVNHPLAQALNAYLLCGSTQGAEIDLVAGGVMPWSGTTVLPVSGVTVRGPSLHTSAGVIGGLSSNFLFSNNGSGDYTIAGQLIFNAIPTSGDHQVFGQSDVNTSNGIDLYITTGGVLKFESYGSPGNLGLTAGTPAVGVLYTLAFTRSGNVITCYFNGATTSSTAAVGSASSGTIVARLAAWPTYTSQTSIDYLAVAGWNRALSADEVASFAADPYSILMPVDGDLSILSGASAVPSGVLAATETKDIAALTGSIEVSGTLAVTETPDTARLTNVAARIYTRFGFEGYGVRRAGNFSRAAAAVTGTLAATEAPDIASITGSGVSPSGSLAATETQDAAVLVGTAGGASGTLVASEAQDLAALAGSFAVPSGILVATEAADVCAITGTVVSFAIGTLAATEAADIAEIRCNFAGKFVKSKVPYPSIWDYGWYNKRPPLRR